MAIVTDYRTDKGVSMSGATHHFDVVVVGSGAAGLVAALRAADSGLNVLVLEKARQLGGTTAVGGGAIWVPDNHLMANDGFLDSPAQARAYLDVATAGRVAEDRVEWFIRTAPLAIRYLQDHTRVSLIPLPRPDYHPEWPGAAEGGRSLDNEPFDTSGIPGLVDRIRPPTYFPPITMIERDKWQGSGLDHELIAKRKAAGTRTMGGALAAALVASAEDRGITIIADAAVTAMMRDDSGNWNVEYGAPSTQVTSRAVVVASGGFEWNPRLQSAFLGFPVVPISAPSNEGDGLSLALAAGAAVENMTSVWGVPVIQDPEHRYDGKPSGRIANIEMTLPGSITVDSSGRRFVNEALNYHDLNKVFGSIDPASGKYRHDPAWLIFDGRFQRRYSVAGSPVGKTPPWVLSAPTVEGIAQLCGIDAEGLRDTIQEFNEHARAGEDPAFHRGASTQDRHLGDPRNLPNPSLAPLEEAPYFAVRIHAGALGTSGGVRTDNDGRVLGASGDPIAGLFAAGNVSSSVFGDTYPGGGATLGSAVTRAFAIGEALAAEVASGRRGDHFQQAAG